MKAGFIGLGNLGSAMAKRLIEEGVTLTLWNRTISKAASFKSTVAKSPKHLAEDCNIIFLNLFDSNAVKEVLLGENGLFSGDCANKVIVDTTTNHPEMVLEFHSEAEKRSATYIEAPVLGSVVPASKGALTILVSGSDNGYELALPYLKKLGQNIFYLKTPSLATKMKLINNLILGTFMASICEALTIAEKSGVDKAKALEIFANGAGSSMVLNAKKDKLANSDFSPHFSSAAIYKDLHYLQELTYNLKKPMLIGSVVKDLFGFTFKDGTETQDFSVIYKIFAML